MLFVFPFGCAAPEADPVIETTGSDLSACKGVKVPGDYATIQEAVDAGNPSICIAAGTFSEHVEIGRKETKLRGAGKTKTHIDQIHVYESNAEISDLAVDATLTIGHVERFVAQRCTLYSDGFVGERAIELAGKKGDIEIANSDISAPNGTAVFVYFPAGNSANWPEGTFNLSIHDNVIHDGVMGIDLDVGSRGNEAVRIERNVVRGFSDTALTMRLYDNSSAFRLFYDRNHVASSKLGIVLGIAGYDGTVIEHSGNVLTGNVTNYAGVARPD